MVMGHMCVVGRCDFLVGAQVCGGGWWWGRGLGVCGEKPKQLQPTWLPGPYVSEGMPNVMVS